ncbi:hypothetical protein ACFL6Y_08030 [Elusimicrobiota bacterium]
MRYIIMLLMPAILLITLYACGPKHEENTDTETAYPERIENETDEESEDQHADQSENENKSSAGYDFE